MGCFSIILERETGIKISEIKMDKVELNVVGMPNVSAWPQDLSATNILEGLKGLALSSIQIVCSPNH